jgi:hypothetical protein
MILLLSSTSAGYAQSPAPQLVVLGGAPVLCEATGKRLPAVQQGRPFSFKLRGLPFGPAIVTFTLPDGRVYQPTELANPAFDGITDLPMADSFPPAPSTINILPNVTNFGPFSSDFTWPTGCYTATVTSDVGAVRAQGQFVLTAPDERINPGKLSLIVLEQISRQATAQQSDNPLAIEITGRGIPTGASVALTVRQPNGTVLDISIPPDQPFRGGIGLLVSIDNTFQVGTYTFILTTIPRQGSGSPPLRATAQFQLTAQSFPALGDAELEVLDPLSHTVPQVNVPGNSDSMLPGILH